MDRTQCVLALIALFVGLAHSWDIAVSLGDELVFYTNGSETSTVRFKSQNLTALAYDEVHNMMLYVDKQSDNDALCGYSLHSKENKCFIKRNSSNIHSIAFDPATDTLFFIDTNEMSINWITLKPGSNSNIYGNLLIKMDDRTPSDIAVDSCRGYIYWTYRNYVDMEYMERARFNGSDREVLNTWLPIFSLAMDPQTREIHYFDGCDICFINDQYEFLKIADWNGQKYNLRLLHRFNVSAPQELTVTKDYLYWMNSSESYSTVWFLPKHARDFVEPKEFSKFYNKRPLGLAANYKIKDQIQGIQDCEALSSLIPKVTAKNSLNIQWTKETEQTTECTTVAELFCFHGTKDSETSVCKCTPGYIGERCDVSVCENYCLQGDCSFNDEGLPKCRCNAGYSGERCEVYACHGYCLNNGDCSLNDKTEPVCQCKRDYLGDRCEVSDCLNYCIQGECSFNEEGAPKCRCSAGYSGERCEVYACHGYCLNNGDCSLNDKTEPVCQCKRDYLGDRCEVSDCLNYCIQGECSFNEEGAPKCRCSAGYSGERCEVYACHGYCLNNGDCSLSEEDEPVCQCVGNHEGTRCEAVKDVTRTFTNTSTNYSAKGNLTLADLLSN